MNKRYFLVIFLTIIFAVSHSIILTAAEKPSEKRDINPIIRQIVDYALPELGNYPEKRPVKTTGKGTASLGATSFSASPGVTIGNTYFDIQHINTTGRIVGTGDFFLGSDTSTLVHFTWMDLPGPDLANSRNFAYAAALVLNGEILTEIGADVWVEVGGYFNLDVTPDNRAIISGHWTPDGDPYKYAPTVWYDEVAPGDAGFGVKARVDTALWQYENPFTGKDRNTLWPHMAFQVKPDGSQITHLTGATYAGGIGPHILYYYRREGHADSSLGDGSLSSCFISGLIDPQVNGWDCPWVYDTAWATVALVTASKKSGKVALGWTANLPEPGCDTCSINNDMGTLRNRNFNDLYYQTSDDYGISWNPRVNVTHFDTLTERWGPYNDITMLWTGDSPNEELHIAWVATDIERYLTQGFLGFGSRIYHWAETFSDLGFGKRVAVHLPWDPIMCQPLPFNLLLAKPQLSQCNDNLYILFADLWDGHNGDPANPDCSQRGYDGDYFGSVNGELMVSISDNNGVSWDLPHNLTNSFTPACDSATGAVGQCESDHFASMAPYGFVTTASDGAVSGATVIPRPVSYPNTVGTSWLPVMYINDRDPGAVIFDNSTWQNNPVKFFYMACVAPDQIIIGPGSGWPITEIGWPTFTPPGVQLDIAILLENTTNEPMTYSIEIEELSGSAGWLGVSGFSFYIPNGAGNTDLGYINLNVGGIIDDPISSPQIVEGRLILNMSNIFLVDTLSITLIVTDTIITRITDTITTGVVSLAVAHNTQFGMGGTAGYAGVRMDYFYHPDECDIVDSIPGNTEVYIYDGSMIFGNIVDGDTILSNSIFSQGPLQESSIYTHEIAEVDTTGEVFNYLRFPSLSNADTTIGASLTYFAPKMTQTWDFGNGNVWQADQQFVTKEFKIWAIDSMVHEGMVVGEVIDWDIPADIKDVGGTSSDNVGEVNSALNLLYIYGAEYNNDDSVECQDNDLRFGGMAFGYTKQYFADSHKWSITDTVPYGGYHEANARYVYTGWDDNELYFNMETAAGFITWGPWLPAESTATDLHSVLTYTFGHDLQPGDTLAFYSVIATVLNNEVEAPAGLRIEELAVRGRNFMTYFGCCHGRRGDLNSDGKDANILDLTFAVDRIMRGGRAPTCLGESDINADGSPMNILDLTFIVDVIFRGGIAPYNCSDAPCNTPGCHD